MDQDSSNSPRFSSLTAMILATSGVAIGLGNVWRFPYMMAENGGSAFLLVYLVIVFALGIPTLMAEWALGRYARCGPAEAFRVVRMPGARLWSVLLLVTITMAASYYCAILAQVLASAVASGVALVGADSDSTRSLLTEHQGVLYGFLIVTTFLACAALNFGVEKGIERFSKIIIPLCFVLFIILIVRSLTLDGAMDGIKQYLAPKPENFTAGTGLAALGQAFFSIGLGGTFMVTYGSYMRRKDSIPAGAIATAMADVGAALLAGMIVIPAAIALNIKLESGPPLLFNVMPQVFANMPAGHLFSLMFFASLFLIALLSLMGSYEVMVDYGKRLLGLGRRQALTAIFFLGLVLSIPAVLSDAYVGISDKIWGNTMHPFGSAIAIIALFWCLGRSKALGEIRGEGSLPFASFLYYWLRYVAPTVILFILISGWIAQPAPEDSAEDGTPVPVEISPASPEGIEPEQSQLP